MALFLSTIDSKIRTTLSERERLIDQNRSGWFSNKTPWIRFTSLANVGNDSNLRKKWILYGGTSLDKNGNTYASGLKNMYNMSSDRFKNDSQGTYEKGNSIFNRPIPGVTEISIQNKGSMGAVREAVITYVCWDRRQLSMLEKLYMTPGISCLLEWGWSTKINNSFVNENLSKKSPPPSDEEMSKKISELVKLNGGHYDALQGPVVDFSWTLRDDGGYDCTTTLTSRADMLLAINIHSKSGDVTSDMVDDGEDEDSINEDIRGILDNVIRDIEENGIKTNNDGEVIAQILKVRGKFKKEDDELGSIDKGKGIGGLGRKVVTAAANANALMHGLPPTGKLKNEINNFNQGYITWGFLEDIINENLCPHSEKLGKLLIKLETDKKIDDIQYGWINYRTNLISGDPYICVLPNASMQFGGQYTKRIRKKGRPAKIKDTESDIDNYQFYEIDPDVKKDFFKDGGKDRIQLSKILINVRFVHFTFLESDTLSDFLMTILNGISEACGNMWDFQLMIDEEDPGTIYIVDTKTVNVEDIDPFPFKVYTKNSIVKNVSLNTEVDQKIKAMMMYGSTRNDDEKYNETGIESTYGYKLYRDSVVDIANGSVIPANQAPGTSTSSTKNDSKTNKIDTQSNLYISIKKLKRKRTPETSDRAKMAMNKYIVETNTDNGSVSSNNSFVTLPLKLAVTVDGISGIRFGNAIDIDYKPERYSKYTYFQITNVSHTINKDGWDTSFETIMRVDMNAMEGIKSPRTTFSSMGQDLKQFGKDIYGASGINKLVNPFRK